VDPVGAQAPHGLDFSKTPASGLAEIRAYYFGTMFVLATLLYRGVVGKATHRVRGLKIGGGTLGLFALARVYSFFIDGPPENSHAEIMWAAEALGALAAFALWWLEEGRATTWGRGLVALAAQEPLSTPGEVVGNLAGIFTVYLFGWGDAVGDVLAAEGVLRLIGANLVRYTLAYVGAFYVFYRLKWLAQAKFHQDAKGLAQYEDSELLRRELARWGCGVAIGTSYDVLLRRALATEKLPELETSSLQSMRVVWLTVALVLFVDLHFYSMHRVLHTPYLYKRIHSSHHQSRNPNPFSGLSFHPIESAMYFSSLPIGMFLAASFGCPLHRFHYCVLKGLLDFNPIWGHASVGGWFGGSYHHYIHHTRGYRLHVNFGGTWLFDGLLGTGHVEPRPGETAKRAD
jgi:sterol desaturase/sphingolipid hydroxylase (fatty acid hydroxylase superfamily)